MRIFAKTLLGALLAVGVLLASPAAPGAQMLCVKSPRANLRDGPGTNHRITWEVNRYMPLVQVDKKGDWLKVKDVDGDTHWIFAKLVDSTGACVTIRAAKANIRVRPTTRSDKWFTVERYAPFKRLGVRGKWVQIEYEGQTMWVFHTLVWPAPS
ncbi:MAG: SH3 domain-containing protein [bacterium]